MSKDPIFYGGQAVIGGVLINSPNGWSIAVRDSDGKIKRYYEERIPLVKRNAFFSTPLIRGLAALVDSLIVGYKGLDLSDKIIYNQRGKESLISSLINYLLLVAILFLFITGPRLLIDLFDLTEVLKGLIEGLFRGIILFLYIYLLGRTDEAQELFQYHGAEHMTIAAFEEEEDLSMEAIKKYPKEHLRCGTSFLFLIIVVSLITLPFIPTFGIIGTLATRVIHIFLVSMISYEVLKLNFKFENSLFSKFFGIPGLWVQKYTTKKPSDDQIRVAQVSMANAILFSMEDGKYLFDSILNETTEISNE